jgi:hypothetical protein
MKITFLTGEYPPMQGGIADHTAYLAHHLTAHEAVSSILINRRWNKTEAATPTLLADPAARHPVIYPLLSNWGWRCWREIPHFLNTYSPDILHILKINSKTQVSEAA